MDVVIEHLTKIYRGKVHALKGVDLTLGSGMFGLVGPNGAGKTTLMRILAGILHSSSGSVRVGQWDVATGRGRAEIKRVLGYLPQELGVYPDLSAREFLDYIAILKGIETKADRRQRVNRLLGTVALSDVADRKLRTFSGGMKRRVGIAQALLNDPKLLIVDEPTAGLDPEERIRFRNLLADLAGDRIVLLSTHIVEDVAQICPRLAVMADGRVIFSGSASELVHRARDYVWLVTTDGAQPAGDLTIVSTLHLGETVQYRVIGHPLNGETATPVQPTLEDGYIWLMHGRRTPIAAA